MSDPTPPVAIVGIGCRFPGGADTVGAFWDLLTAGTETSSEIPAERWQWYRDLSPDHDAAVGAATRRGHFLADVTAFDPTFFGLSPREAELMDPQQRILLETTWRALEHAGIPASALAGSDTGVFVGACNGDFGHRQMEDLPGIEAWTGIGSAMCAVANRVSYVLDLRGPSIVVDTACSASLVALHLASQALRSGECGTALAGGVNLVLGPGETISLDAAGALAPDGRSKPFDEAADGYGRGEGCGVLVLRLLSDAVRDGDRVLAVVRGSAVRQDGRTNGIMAASPVAQEQVMRAACAAAGVDPRTVDFVEAHGTGTRLGDPVEVSALSAVYGADRTAADPCTIGSVKSIIGHAEGAAGVAGVIKAVLALGRDGIPGTPIGRPNPDIDWEHSGLQVGPDAAAWPDREHPRRAAVSGFGYGGTIGHVVLEQAPVAVPAARAPRPEPGPAGPISFPLSAATPAALAATARVLTEAVAARPDLPLDGVAHTLALRRAHLGTRAVVTADGRDQLLARLRRLGDGAAGAGIVTGQVPNGPAGGSVWVFSGHGSQWEGMGRELLAVDPAFAAVIDAIDPVYRAEIGFSPRELIGSGELTGVDRIQAMIFAMQVGLAAAWRARGVEPSAVIGHSVGEVAAAVVSGALTLEDGARLICRRSVLLREVTGRGAMVMVGASFEETLALLAGRTGVSAAISASPVSSVVAGEPGAVQRFAQECTAAGLMVRQVASDVAFHSPQMDPLADRLAAAVADLPVRAPRIPMYRTAVADPRADVVLGRRYWSANLRNPVRLRAAVTAAAEDGHRTFVELSPHPVVAHSVAECLTHLEDEVSVGWTLRRGEPEAAALRDAVAAAHCRGVAVDWSVLQPGGELVDLPGPAWDRRPLWREPALARIRRPGRHDVARHTLLGEPDPVPGSRVQLWHTTLDDGSRPYPGSHAISGTEIVPAAVLVCTFLDALTDGSGELTGIAMRHPVLTAVPTEIRVVRDGTALRLASRAPDGGSDWLVHASATAGPALRPARRRGPERWTALPTDHVQRRLATVGVPDTGFAWAVEQLEQADGRLRALVQAQDSSTWASVLDAVMSIAPCAFGGEPELRMVVHTDAVRLIGTAPHRFVVDVNIDPANPDEADALVTHPDGSTVAEVTGLRYPVIGRLGGTGDADTGDAADAAVDRLTHLAPGALREVVLGEVSEEIVAEMRLEADTLEVRRSLVELGLDSVMTVVIRRRLQRRFGHELPASLLWQQPTVVSITDHLTALLLADRDGSADRTAA